MNAILRPFGFRVIAEPPARGVGDGSTTGVSRAAPIDADEEGWRPLSRTRTDARDLLPMAQRRMQELAVYSWERNRLANRLVELPLAYLIAGGVRLEADDEEAQAWLDAHWRDPINAWDLKLPKRVRELSLFGEQCWPVFVGLDGHVRLTAVDPSHIVAVVLDPDNDEQAIGVEIQRAGEEKRTLRTIVDGPEEVFGDRARQLRAAMPQECFYFRVNELSAGTRGRSDLLSAIDWCDAYEELLFGEVEGAELRRSVLWDVTMKGADEAALRAKAREIDAPKPNTVRVHNENETWTVVAPKLETQDVSVLARLIKGNVLGGATVPEHWYGEGGDVNRATASEMGDPAVKVLSLRQEAWKAILEQVGAYQVRKRLEGVGADVAQLAADPAYRVRAVMPEITSKDTTRFAAALQQVVGAAAAAADRGLMSEQTAAALLASIAVNLGVEIDPKAELETARAEAKAREEERADRDAFRLPPALAADPAGDLSDDDPEAP